MMNTPIALLIFNRPELTGRVFAQIARARPHKLLIVGDGPRLDRPGEAEKCAAARAVVERVDWDCEVLKNYSDSNLGCRRRVSTGLDWVFENVDEAIVLEDDCLPSQSFFGYCEELLRHYRDDTRVMQICGLNVFQEWNRGGNSYFFSNYGPVWGWASWRRAWKYYDVHMKLWPEIRGKKLYEDFCQSREEMEYRLDLYNQVYAGKIDTWDYQWGFAKMINAGLSIIPVNNMIANIGCRLDPTHSNPDNSFSNLERNELTMPLKHPEYVIKDSLFDIDFNRLYIPNESEPIFKKIIRRVMGN